MKKGEKNRYITRTNSGELVLSRDDGQKTVLFKNMTGDFDAHTEGDGSVDIFGVSSDSNLVHIRYSGEEVMAYTVLESKSKESRICSVRVYKINGRFHLFYCINHTDRLLVHHVVDRSDYAKEPMVIDRIGEKNLYDIAKDEDNNIYILYSSNDTLLKRKYTYSTKTYSQPETVAEYEIYSLSALCHGGRLYGAFTAADKGRVSVFVCDTEDRNFAEVGVKVHVRTEVSLVPDADGIFVQWVENSMCFGVPCSVSLDKERVKILGRSPGLARPKFIGGEVLVSKAAINLSRQLFCRQEDITVVSKAPQLEPVGQEVDMLSRKYIEVLSRKNDLVDFERELTRIEASLERLVMLVESALERTSVSIDTENNIVEEDKEE